MKRFPFKFNSLHSALLVLFACSFSAYGEEVEFDENFLNTVAGQPTVDVSKFRTGNPIPSGEYPTDVFVNGARHGNLLLKVVENSENPVAGICFTPELAAMLSLKSEAVAHSPRKDCVSVVDAVPKGKIQFDLGSLALNVEIPQALVIKRPRGYVSPSQWQSGSPVAFVRYDANQYVQRSNGQRYHNRYLGLKAGVNLAGWAVRHQGSQSWLQNQKQPYVYEYTYAQTDIDTLKGQLTLGDFHSHSDFFDNFAIRGVGIASDDRMLPYSQRGYAPRIEGIANSNAKVIVRHNGYILYETTVPAGAFQIDDLYPAGYSGTLDVEIIEADGQVRKFSVPYSNAVRLVRAGQLRYKAVAGRYRERTNVFDVPLFQAQLQYGVANGLTLNLGTMASRDYLSGLTGVAFDTPIGAFSTDVIYTKHRLPQFKQGGKQYAVNVGYRANIGNWGSYFSASYYRAFSKDQLSLQQVIHTNEFGKFLPKSYPLQQRISFSLNQSLGEGFGSFSLSGIRNQYWDLPKPSYEYQFNYGNSYKRLQYQLGYAHIQDSRIAKMDKQFSLNLSWRLGSDLHSPSLYSQYKKQNDGNMAYTSLLGTLGDDHQFHYGLSSNRYFKQTSHSINAGYKASFATINSGITKSQHSQQMNVNLSGAVVAHPYGITLSNDLGDSFAIVNAKGAVGAKINNGNAARLDWFGNGIVPHTSPYQSNYIGIDPNNIPDDVEIEATGQEIIPRANSAVVVKFATKSGKNVLFDVSLADGSAPPLAAEVLNEQDELVGYVVQGGQIFVKGIPQSGRLRVVWGDSTSQRCQFDYQLSDKAVHPVQCVAK